MSNYHCSFEFIPVCQKNGFQCFSVSQPNANHHILGPVMIVHLYDITGMIIGLHLANERRHYFVTTSLIGWVQA